MNYSKSSINSWIKKDQLSLFVSLFHLWLSLSLTCHKFSQNNQKVLATQNAADDYKDKLPHIVEHCAGHRISISDATISWHFAIVLILPEMPLPLLRHQLRTPHWACDHYFCLHLHPVCIVVVLLVVSFLPVP